VTFVDQSVSLVQWGRSERTRSGRADETRVEETQATILSVYRRSVPC
jgi:hypothetical protein